MKGSLYAAALSFVLYSCAQQAPTALSIDQKELQLKISQKKITILYFWTSWCGVSNNIIPETYLPLADSIENGDYNANVILLCGSSGIDSQVTALRKPALQSYYINKVGNGMAIIDRNAIKKFIKELFPEHTWEQLDEFGFGIPITLVVDDKLKIIHEVGPQDIQSLLTIVK
jgi:hypothetical protein